MPRFAVVPLALLLPLAARAVVVTGTAADESCASRDILPCEMVYAVHLDGGAYDDWQLDASGSGGGRTGFQPGDVAGDTFALDASRFTRTANVTDVAWTMVSGSYDEVAFFSHFLDIHTHAGPTRHQLVGDSPPLPASAGIVIPPGGAQYWVPTRSGPRLFPIATMTARLIAFAPLADLQGATPAGCDVGAAVADPATGRGIIRGYNIYRAAGPISAPPDPEDCFRGRNAYFGMPGWLDFIDLDTFDMSSATRPDLNRADLAYFDNPDGLPYTGDEVIYYSDAEYYPWGGPRPQGPDMMRDYWYLIQPVLRGSVSDFASVSIAGAPPRDCRLTLNGSSRPNAVDLDGDGAADFLSPQVEAGYPGLGLYPRGGPSPPCMPRPPRMIFAPCDSGGHVLAASGQVTAQARLDRGDVIVTASFGQPGSIVSFDVMRCHGASRVRVNDQPILLTGTEGESHEVRDAAAVLARGLARPTSYEIVVRDADGLQATAATIDAPDLARLRRR